MNPRHSLLALLLACLGLYSTHAAVIHGSLGDIASLLQSASHGDVLELSTGPFQCSPAGVLVDKNVTISPVAGQWLSIDCQQRGRAFAVVGAAVTITGVRFQNGWTFSANGGAVTASFSQLTLVACSFVHCIAMPTMAVETSHLGGGALSLESTAASLSHCSFVNCSSGGSGGAVLFYQDSGPPMPLSLFNCSFVTNHAQVGAGLAVHLRPYFFYPPDTIVTHPQSGHSISMVECTFASNVAQLNASGVSITPPLGSSNVAVEVRDSNFTSNYINTSVYYNVFAPAALSVDYGILPVCGHSLSVTGSSFTRNSGGAVGAIGLHAKSLSHYTLAVLASTFAHNSGESCDIILESGMNDVDGSISDAVITVNGSSFSHCDSGEGSLDLHGGSISSSSFSVDSCLFSGISTAGEGTVGVTYVNASATSWSFVRSSFVGISTADSGALLFRYTAALDLAHVISHCTFADNSGAVCGAVEIDYVELAYNSTLTISDSLFRNNSATEGVMAYSPRSSGEGGAVLVSLGSPMAFIGGEVLAVNCSNTFTNTVFANNSAATSGGAVALHDILPIEISTGTYWVRYVYASTNTFVNCSFLSNSAFVNQASGGALYLSNSNTILRDCVFDNNTAMSYGGAIHSTGFCQLQVETSVFARNHANDGATDIFNSGSANTTITAASVIDVSYTSTGTTAIESLVGYVVFENATMNCPNGQLFHRQLGSLVVGESLQYLQRYSCAPCGGNLFSLQHGALTNSSLFNPPCLVCPVLASCLNDQVSVRTGYWGYVENQRVDGTLVPSLGFALCPSGYCCEHALCAPYDYCSGNRTGPLCGQCLPGFGMQFGSTACRHLSECNDHWVWAIVVLLVCIFLLYLMWKGRKNHRSSGLDRMLINFYQIVGLLFVGGAGTFVQSVLVGLFNFSVNVGSGSLGMCPYVISSGLQKITIEIYVPLGILGLLLLTFLLHAAVDLVYQRHGPPRDARSLLFADPLMYSYVLMTMVLFLYSSFIKAGMRMLNCVDLQDKLVLFSSADITCWQPFQVAVFVLLGIIGMPLPLALRLFARSLSASAHKENTHSHRILTVLESPYHPSARYWESVLMARRFLLIGLGEIVPNQFLSKFLMIVVLLLSIFSHMWIKPFKVEYVQNLEALSLSWLITIAVLNIRNASLVVAGQKVDSGDFAVFQFTQIVELVLVVLPALIAIVSYLPFQKPVDYLDSLFIHRQSVAISLPLLTRRNSLESTSSVTATISD